MDGTAFIDGPAYVASSAADLYVPASSAVYAMVYMIHLANTDSSARTVSLYIGATGGSAGGTELIKNLSISPNSFEPLAFHGGLKLISTTFLSGVASVASTITCTIIGRLYAT